MRRGLILASAALAAFVITGGIFNLTPLVGYRLAHATGASMEPARKDGDLVLLRDVSAADLEVGDVAVYRAFGIEIMHRVIEKRVGEDGELILVTQGDNVPRPDAPIKASQVSGEFVGEVPLLGWISRQLGAKGGFYVYRSVVLAMALSAVAVWGLRAAARRERRQAHSLATPSDATAPPASENELPDNPRY